VRKYPSLPAALESTRVLVDAHDEAFWSENLYNAWLSSLRTLSARDTQNLPTVAKTDAWLRRILNTQLGSWAQLRHDTLLYAKQSYTSGISCEYPDAYVEPYPEFFAALKTFAMRGSALAQVLAGGVSDAHAENISAYFTRLASAMDTLGSMAKAQRAGTPFDKTQLAFINQAVHNRGGVCGGPQEYDGWFAQLHFNASPTGVAGAELKPTIADVHTQPTDAAGNDVGRILHVGTGLPRLMVVTVDSCQGPRAYAGPTLAYHEVITEQWKRLTDEEWKSQLYANDSPKDAPWATYVSPRE
jgi:outer membrane murein-binding lipoprotein Lpp